MGFLGRNINLALIALLLILILAATGVTILYQQGLRQRTTQYENVSSNLSMCQTTLTNYQDVLGQKEVQLNETSQDIRKYDQLYSQKVSELNTTQGQLTSTQQQLTDMTLQKEQYKNLYGQALLNISAQQYTIIGLNSQIDSYRSSLSSCQNSLSSCQAATKCP